MSTDTTRISTWLKANRANATQEWLAADIERVTGWHITRDRYSKYESGSLPIGRVVLKHFTDYWATRDVPGPDFSPVAGESGTTDSPAALIAAITAQTEAITAVLDRLTAADDDREARLRALEAEVRSLREQRAGEASPELPAPRGSGR